MFTEKSDFKQHLTFILPHLSATATRTLLILIITHATVADIILDRNPRYLPFPRGIGNKLQVITGFGIPVPNIKDDVTYGLIIKSNYALPTNSSQFTQPELAFENMKSGAQISRIAWYNVLKTAMDRLQIQGDSCLLLTICQASFTIFEQQGLLGEIMKVMFLPSTTPGEALLVPNEFKEAEEIGEKAEDEAECRQAYPSCDKSIIEMMTTLEDNKFVKMMLNTL